MACGICGREGRTTPVTVDFYFHHEMNGYRLREEGPKHEIKMEICLGDDRGRCYSESNSIINDFCIKYPKEKE